MNNIEINKAVKALKRSIRKFGDYDRSKERKLKQLEELRSGKTSSNKA